MCNESQKGKGWLRETTVLPYSPVITIWAYRKEILFSGHILGHGRYFGPRRIHGH